VGVFEVEVCVEEGREPAGEEDTDSGEAGTDYCDGKFEEGPDYCKGIVVWLCY
jgi:hypothetical protein